MTIELHIDAHDVWDEIETFVRDAIEADIEEHDADVESRLDNLETQVNDLLRLAADLHTALARHGGF